MELWCVSVLIGIVCVFSPLVAGSMTPNWSVSKGRRKNVIRRAIRGIPDPYDSSTWSLEKNDYPWIILNTKTNVPSMPLAKATTVFKIHFELLKWSPFIEMLLVFVIANERTYVTFMIVQKKKKKLFFLLHFSDSCFIVFVIGFLELWTHGRGWDIGKNDRSHNNYRPGCNMVSEFTRFK